jgi:transposase-like protein
MSAAKQLTLPFAETAPAEVCAVCPRCGTASAVIQRFSSKDVFTCPHCERTFEVKVEHRGKERRTCRK